MTEQELLAAGYRRFPNPAPFRTASQFLPLPESRTKADAIFSNRVAAVRKIVLNMQQGSLFQEEFDPMTVTSCGLYCGK